LSPADFVPIAEESDLIVQLGSYILSRAVTDIARWQKDLPRPEQPLFVNVNVSSRQLIKPDLVQEVRHLMARAVLPTSTLRLEISEALVMENPEQSTQILELLKEAGVGLALDDFGTGYSSLAYLNRFPFDTIKIDRSLVQAGGVGDSGAVIVRSIVALAHELGKKIVADGIEMPEDAAQLRSIGCHYAQGFYYGEPMDEAETSRLLRLIRKADRRMRRRGMVRGQEKEKKKAVETTVPLAEAETTSVPRTAPPRMQPVSQPISQPVSQPAAARSVPPKMVPQPDSGPPTGGVPPPQFRPSNPPSGPVPQRPVNAGLVQRSRPSQPTTTPLGRGHAPPPPPASQNSRPVTPEAPPMAPAGAPGIPSGIIPPLPHQTPPPAAAGQPRSGFAAPSQPRTTPLAGARQPGTLGEPTRPPPVSGPDRKSRAANLGVLPPGVAASLARMASNSGSQPRTTPLTGDKSRPGRDDGKPPETRAKKSAAE
jgi:EAL domain-containing protein (putative c-di-GMP-specific phosphodiesterase class I)